MSKYQVIKRYGHDVGLSCAFRQWRAESHCRFIHGYALAIEITFESDTLDGRNWVIDFGSLGALKQELVALFDHKMIVAQDDPELNTFRLMGAPDTHRVIDLVVLPATGCEFFAQMIHEIATRHVVRQTHALMHVRVASVKVSEHPGNAAVYVA